MERKAWKPSETNFTTVRIYYPHNGKEDTMRIFSDFLSHQTQQNCSYYCKLPISLIQSKAELNEWGVGQGRWGKEGGG